MKKHSVCLLHVVLILGLPVYALAQGEPSLQNGDVNGDGEVDLSDPVYTLNFLFLGGPPPVEITCGAGTDCPSEDDGIARSFGKSYGELAGEWWQWLTSIPLSAPNPQFVQQGAIDCSQGQEGDIWFLAGTTGTRAGEPPNPVARFCNVPCDKALFFPLTTSMFFNEPDENFTVEEKRTLLDQLRGSDVVCNLSCTVNGEPSIFEAPFVRAQSPTFPVEIIADSILSDAVGHVDPEAVAEGHWILLPPLEPGQHEIRFTGGRCDPCDERVREFDTTYVLTVVCDN